MSSFFFNDTATTEIYTLSLHDALPISGDNDLVLGIDRGLGVVALDEAILGLHDPALGIGEIALCVVLGHAAWRLAFAAPLGRHLAVLARTLAGGGLRLRLERRLGLADLGQPAVFVGNPIGQFVTTPGTPV